MFCVFTDLDKANYDALDVNRWEFYILSTSFLDQHSPDQKSISLSTFQRFCDSIEYMDIKKEVDSVLGKHLIKGLKNETN